jgi:hypothetical protein
MMQNGFQRNRQCGIMAFDDHAERVAYQKRIHAGTIEQARHGGVVDSEHSDFFATLFLFLQIADAHTPGGLSHAASMVSQDDGKN